MKKLLILTVVLFTFSCSDDDTVVEIKDNNLGESAGTELFIATFDVQGEYNLFRETPNIVAFQGRISNPEVPQNSVTASFSIESSNPSDVFTFDSEMTNVINASTEYPITTWFNAENGTFEWYNIYLKFANLGERNVTVTITNSLNTTITLNKYIIVE